MTRDTVFCDTPASRATSLLLARAGRAADGDAEESDMTLPEADDWMSMTA
jgi:hypothetical protein